MVCARAAFFFMPQKDIYGFPSFFQFRNARAKRKRDDDAETTLQTRLLCFSSAKPIFTSSRGVFIIARCARFDERVKTVLLLLRGGRERDRIHHFFQRVVVVVKGIIGVFNEFDTLARVRF
jgi:hypothetical protein